MTSIGQVTAAVAAARQDTTLALANLNLEVNLFTKRVSPPVEYQGVGQHLAQWRLKEAQDGTQHTTARKLGILFREVLPTTPALIKAYGTRASEIGSSARANPKGNSFSYGPFGDRIGADATALWAAATSGHAAIQCHLLACMLARMWDAPEATSLWEEIVTPRKREIEAQFEAQFEAEGDIRTDSMLAVVEQFPRADLAKWDASCRSWLRVADSEKATQQTKLRLIVDNLDLPVNNKPDTYDSVLTSVDDGNGGSRASARGHPIGVADWRGPSRAHVVASLPRFRVFGGHQPTGRVARLSLRGKGDTYHRPRTGSAQRSSVSLLVASPGTSPLLWLADDQDELDEIV